MFVTNQIKPTYLHQYIKTFTVHTYHLVSLSSCNSNENGGLVTEMESTAKRLDWLTGMHIKDQRFIQGLLKLAIYVCFCQASCHYGNSLQYHTLF